VQLKTEPGQMLMQQKLQPVREQGQGQVQGQEQEQGQKMAMAMAPEAQWAPDSLS
jgi:hypothetical protein